MHSAVPDQVSGVRFLPSANENTLSVEWSRPQSDAPILYYEIRSRQLGHSWQGTINATTEMVTLQRSLEPMNSYGIQVRAVSKIGKGPYSSETVLQGLFFCTYKCNTYTTTYCTDMCTTGAHNARTCIHAETSCAHTHHFTRTYSHTRVGKMLTFEKNPFPSYLISKNRAL